MKKIIILEGPDGSGKSTAAKMLQTKFGYIHVHEGPPPPELDPQEYYWKKLLHYIEESQRTSFVLDRFHLGELVYAPIARTPRFTYRAMDRISEALTSADGTCIICLPSFSLCFRNWEIKLQNKNDYLKSYDRFRDSYYRFKALSSYFPTWNYESQSLEDFLLSHRLGILKSVPEGVEQ